MEPVDASPSTPSVPSPAPVLASAPAPPPAPAPVVAAAEAAGLDLDAVAAELAAVEAALGRLDEGRYGVCASCDAPIADAVLATDPTATACAAHRPA